MSAIDAGPNIVRNGLVLNLDASFFKSYPSNRFLAYGTGNVTENVTFANQGNGTFQRVATGTVIGGYKIKANDVVYSYVLGTNGCHYHGNTARIPSGVYATFSFDYLVTGATNYPSTNYLANFENYGGGALGAAVVAPNSLQDIWQRVSFTAGPTSSAGTQAMLLYPGACGGTRLADSGTIYFRNPKVEYTNVDTGNAKFSVNYTGQDTWTDLSGNNNSGTLTNGPVFNVNNGGSISFDGVDDYVTFGNILANLTDLTLECFVKFGTQSTGYNGIISKTLSNANGWEIRTGGGQTSTTTDLEFRYVGDNAAIGFGTLTNGIWYHIVATGTSGSQRTYINGVQAYTNNIALYPSANSNSLVIGKLAYSALYANMNMACARIYNRVLFAAEVSQNYQATKTRFGL